VIKTAAFVRYRECREKAVQQEKKNAAFNNRYRYDLWFGYDEACFEYLSDVWSGYSKNGAGLFVLCGTQR
jgi:hypothetical protein